jgi:hypothetical protein
MSLIIVELSSEVSTQSVRPLCGKKLGFYWEPDCRHLVFLCSHSATETAERTSPKGRDNGQ